MTLTERRQRRRTRREFRRKIRAIRRANGNPMSAGLIWLNIHIMVVSVCATFLIGGIT